MKNYQLTLEERVELKVLISEGYKKSEVARKMDRNRSTIGRELDKWGIKGDLQTNIKNYDPNLAQWYKVEGKRIVKKGEYKLLKNRKLLRIVLKKLKKKWSPEQVSNWLKKKYWKSKIMNVSHETIYKYIYELAAGQLKERLISYLRKSKRIRKSSKARRKGGSTIKDRVSIDKRPGKIEKRKEIGHWEGDLIIGKNKKKVIGTLVERVTRYTIIVRPRSRKSKDVVKAFAKALKKIPAKFKKSMTYDNGTEMARHKLFTKLTGMPVYFCHPYSSWERGTNENTNGLIRDFWPKKTSFENLSYYEIRKVQKLLNERPRKILNWGNPKNLLFLNDPNNN